MCWDPGQELASVAAMEQNKKAKGAEDIVKDRGRRLIEEMAAASSSSRVDGAGAAAMGVGMSVGQGCGGGGHVTAVGEAASLTVDKDGAVTMGAMQELLASMLDMKLAPLNNSVASVQQQLKGVHEEVWAELKDVGAREQGLAASVGQNAAKMIALEGAVERIRAGGGGSVDDGWSESGSVMSMMSRIAEMEVELAKLRDGRERGVVAVTGGLTRYDGEACKAWLGTRLTQHGAEKPTDMHWKGGWANMMWMKFTSVEARDGAVKAVKELGIDGVWAAPDRPLAERVVRSFLLDLKKPLVDCGL